MVPGFGAETIRDGPRRIANGMPRSLCAFAPLREIKKGRLSHRDRQEWASSRVRRTGCRQLGRRDQFGQPPRPLQATTVPDGHSTSAT